LYETHKEVDEKLKKITYSITNTQNGLRIHLPEGERREEVQILEEEAKLVE
jgi:hypothetical protein